MKYMCVHWQGKNSHFCNFQNSYFNLHKRKILYGLTDIKLLLHFRSCGQVFCDDCTKYYKPVPHQYLPNPERVCVRCYQSVTDGLSAIMADGVVDANLKEEGAVASC